MEKKLQVKDLAISFRTQGGKVQAVRHIRVDRTSGDRYGSYRRYSSGRGTDR